MCHCIIHPETQPDRLGSWVLLALPATAEQREHRDWRCWSLGDPSTAVSVTSNAVKLSMMYIYVHPVQPWKSYGWLIKPTIRSPGLRIIAYFWVLTAQSRTLFGGPSRPLLNTSAYTSDNWPVMNAKRSAQKQKGMFRKGKKVKIHLGLSQISDKIHKLGISCDAIACVHWLNQPYTN